MGDWGVGGLSWWATELVGDWDGGWTELVGDWGVGGLSWWATGVWVD